MTEGRHVRLGKVVPCDDVMCVRNIGNIGSLFVDGGRIGFCKDPVVYATTKKLVCGGGIHAD